MRYWVPGLMGCGRMKIKSWLLDVGIMAVLATAILWWQSRDALSADDNVHIAPMTLPMLSGGVGEIAPDPERKTLVYFFAPWCSVCRASIGNLEYVNTDSTRVVVIALDYSSVGEVQAFVDRAEVEFPVYLGNDNVMMTFHVRAYPSYFILDSNFKVLRESVGYSSALGLKLRT